MRQEILKKDEHFFVKLNLQKPRNIFNNVNNNNVLQQQN